MHLERPDILLHVLDLLCAGDWYDVVALRRQPRERQLAWRAALLICEGLEAVHQHQILRKVLRAKARHDATEVVGRKVVGTLDLTCQEAATKRCVREDGDAELAAGGEQVRACLVLDVQLERVVLDLDGVNGRDGVGPSDAAGGTFRDADGLDLAVPNIEASVWAQQIPLLDRTLEP